MKNPDEAFWSIKLAATREALEKNNFKVFLADDPVEAGSIFINDILPGTGARSISWGDSMTMLATGILEEIAARSDLELLVTFDPDVPRPEILERRRQALLVDLFVTGTNALTESGHLVNLDMVGNRVAGITFGPRHVVIFIGRNKIVPGLAEARARIKDLAAPMNSIRHDFKTPCVKTARCMDCSSPQRICNTWTVTEKSFPAGRIKVVLINRDLGL